MRGYPTSMKPFKRCTFGNVHIDASRTCGFLRCPKEVYAHVPTVISICLRYLTYDPNYNFDDEDEDDNAMDAEQNDEDYQGPPPPPPSTT